jgi:hypothetical protein
LFGSVFKPRGWVTGREEVAELAPDPEWDELVAWAGVQPPAPAEVTVAPDARASDQPAEDWDALIAKAKATSEAAAALVTNAPPVLAEADEDWDAIIAKAKAAAVDPAPMPAAPVDELSFRRARHVALRAPAPAPESDEWDVAIRRAKRRH